MSLYFRDKSQQLISRTARIAIALACLPGAGAAQGQVGGSVSLASEYSARGVSLSNGRAAPPPTTPPPTTPPMYSEQYVATLNAASEVPPNPTAGTATATGSLAVDPTNRMITATVTTTGVPGVAAHIHQGAIGVNGPIIVPLTESATGSGVWSATAQLTDAQLAALRSGNLYFNVHTVVYPDGQIRGQIHP